MAPRITLHAHGDRPARAGSASQRKGLVEARSNALCVRTGLATLEDDAGRLGGDVQRFLLAMANQR
jgi:hypothetical protein